MKLNLKLKLSRAGYMLAGSVVLAVVFVFLYLGFAGQNAERDLLGSDIRKVQTNLPKITAEARSLESQIAQLENKVRVTKASVEGYRGSFPPATSFSYGEQISRLAERDGVQVSSIKTTGYRDEVFASVTFQVTGFDMKVTGKTADVLAFIRDLSTNRDYVSTAITEFGINEMNKGEASLNISLEVYQVKGG